MRLPREIRLWRVKCLRAWLDLFHFTFGASRIFHYPNPNCSAIIMIGELFGFCRALNILIPTEKPLMKNSK